MDMTALLSPLTGVGQMVRAYADQLALDSAFDLHGFAVSFRGGKGLESATPNGVSTSVVPAPARLAHELWQRIDWPKVSGFDLVHGPNFVVPPTGGSIEVVTIHDMTAWRWPEMVTADSRRYPRLVERALRRGAFVHTVSDFVAGEVQERYQLDPDRIRRIYNGIAKPPSTDGRTGRRISGGGPYVLAVGTIEPRKDYPTLLRAFALMRDEVPDLRLVVAGSDGWGSEEFNRVLAETGLGESVIRPGYVTDQTRHDLIAGAECFVYSSQYEGFGIPPLEAMSHGVPVVATKAGAVPEVLGDAAQLVSVGDAAALAEALTEVISNSETRVTLSARGAHRAAQFDWSSSASELKAWYLELSQ